MGRREEGKRRSLFWCVNQLKNQRKKKGGWKEDSFIMSLKSHIYQERLKVDRAYISIHQNISSLSPLNKVKKEK